MHLALLFELDLCRVPEILVGLRVVQLLPGVEVLPGVLAVQFQRGPGPVLGAVQVVVVGLVVAEVVGQLPADDCLLDEGRNALA